MFYTIIPLTDFNSTTKNILKIEEDIYVKVDKRNLNKESLFYLREGTKKMHPYIKEKRICYDVDVDFDISHYQPEAMYYVFVQWFSEKYNLSFSEVNFDYFDKKFIFPDLKEISKRINE